MLPHKAHFLGYPTKLFYSGAKAAPTASTAHERKIKAVSVTVHTTGRNMYVTQNDSL